ESMRHHALCASMLAAASGFVIQLLVGLEHAQLPPKAFEIDILGDHPVPVEVQHVVVADILDRPRAARLAQLLLSRLQVPIDPLHQRTLCHGDAYHSEAPPPPDLSSQNRLSR